MEHVETKVIPTLQALIDFISEPARREYPYTSCESYMAGKLGLKSGSHSSMRRVERVLTGIKDEWEVEVPSFDCYEPSSFFDLKDCLSAGLAEAKKGLK